MGDLAMNELTLAIKMSALVFVNFLLSHDLDIGLFPCQKLDPAGLIQM